MVDRKKNFPVISFKVNVLIHLSKKKSPQLNKREICKNFYESNEENGGMEKPTFLPILNEKKKIGLKHTVNSGT